MELANESMDRLEAGLARMEALAVESQALLAELGQRSLWRRLRDAIKPPRPRHGHALGCTGSDEKCQPYAFGKICPQCHEASVDLSLIPEPFREVLV